MPKILVVDDEEAIRTGLAEILRDEGYETVTAADASGALQILQAELVDVVCTDVRMPGMSGLDLMARIKTDSPETEVILITGYASLQSAVEAVKAGAHDYLSKPFDLDEVRLTVRRALEKKHLGDQKRHLERRMRIIDVESGLIGESKSFKSVLSMLDRIAPTDSTVLILGETGTGKELVAREIHRKSRRSNRNFIPINCGALPDTLLESELFGHTKGAFTGADKSSEGLFEAADGGSLFLDEIGNISLNMQARLLRVIESGEFMRLGERRVRKVDVRIIAATNAELKKYVEEGRFRQDFYFRLNVMTILIPPLRERRDDISILGDHFLESFARKFGKVIEGYSDDARRAMNAYAWPGNVRELENALERAVILCVTPWIQIEDLPVELSQTDLPPATATSPESLAELERLQILKVLRQSGGHRGKTAELLGINRRTLYRKLIEYGFEKGGGGECEEDDSPQTP